MRSDLQKAWNAAGKMGFATRKPPGPEVIEPALRPEETVLSILRGWKDGTQPCTLVLTDTQLYFFSYAVLKSLSNEESVPFKLITGVELAQAIVTGLEVRISRSGNNDKITNVDKSVAKDFVSKLRELLTTAEDMSNKVKAQTIDPADQLMKLKELLDSGVITEEEFQQKKAILLGRL